MSRRAVAPVVGVVLLVGVTVVLAAIVGAFAIGIGQTDDVPKAAISADMATGETYGNPEILLTHVSGDELIVRNLTIRIFVDGEPLEPQPQVPVAAGMNGFFGAPSAPLQKGKDKTWTAGEETSLVIAGTNSPQPTAGSQVTVKIYTEGEPVATART
ncbi:type IV pilin [Halococcus morrhuae]|uniref:type IV pilin n=1 Tax=Halococcus morrhuae TaxID=2250 RepID=UPI0009B599E5|nr:type IV pilin [Halococcus morrhuae]